MIVIRFEPIDWQDWALPLEVFSVPRGVDIRLLVFECIIQWRKKD